MPLRGIERRRHAGAGVPGCSAGTSALEQRPRRAPARCRSSWMPASALGPRRRTAARLSVSIARPVTITAPRRRASGSSWRTSVDLPTPASPITRRDLRRALHALVERRDERAQLRARGPTNRLSTSCGGALARRAGQHDLVAPVALRVEQRAVGGGEQRLERLAVLRRRRHADRERDAHRCARGSSRSGIASAAVVRRISSASAAPPSASRPGSSTTNSSPA